MRAERTKRKRVHVFALHVEDAWCAVAAVCYHAESIACIRIPPPTLMDECFVRLEALGQQRAPNSGKIGRVMVALPLTHDVSRMISSVEWRRRNGDSADAAGSMR